MYERQRAVAWYTAQSVCVVCSVSVVSACVLFVHGALHEVSPHPKVGSPATHDWTRTPPTSVRAGPGSRATCSPLACLGTEVASAGGVSSSLADLFGKGFLLYAVQTNAQSGWLPTPSRAVFQMNSDSNDHKRNQLLPG